LQFMVRPGRSVAAALSSERLDYFTAACYL
jgi:hypothetical protein